MLNEAPRVAVLVAVNPREPRKRAKNGKIIHSKNPRKKWNGSFNLMTQHEGQCQSRNQECCREQNEGAGNACKEWYEYPSSLVYSPTANSNRKLRKSYD